ncbi:hypothetical protein FY036_02160 [Mesorhizobium microcysteis]|uniref:Uncharacterized protein n=1 Tax=Neoaquamicrobium microcysteis TaxID=2682781 RepID=A0A5D4H6P2_9HYPH|nr:hypothetical protein [Mesorhizobium microcysteis]TYR35689.1 hypothetical protein FY036_02160 [Mesorhizobium microcysteis]
MTGKTMMTEQLIASLAKAPPLRPPALGPMVLMVTAMTGLGIGVWIAIMGLWPDLGSALVQPVVDILQLSKRPHPYLRISQ